MSKGLISVAKRTNEHFGIGFMPCAVRLNLAVDSTSLLYDSAMSPTFHETKRF